MRRLCSLGLFLCLGASGAAIADEPEFYLHVEPAGFGVEAAGERAESSLAGARAAAGLRRVGPAPGAALDRVVAQAGPGAWRDDGLLVQVVVAAPDSVRFLALGRVEIAEAERGPGTLTFRAELALVLFDTVRSAFVLDERTEGTGRAPDPSVAAAFAESEAARRMAARIAEVLVAPPPPVAPPVAAPLDRFYIHVRTRVDDRPFTARGEGSGVEFARALSSIGLREADVGDSVRLHQAAQDSVSPESLQSGQAFSQLAGLAGP